MPEQGLIGAIPSALMAQAARAHAGKIALCYAERSWTFAEFDLATARSGLVPVPGKIRSTAREPGVILGNFTRNAGLGAWSR